MKEKLFIEYLKNIEFKSPEEAQKIVTSMKRCIYFRRAAFGVLGIFAFAFATGYTDLGPKLGIATIYFGGGWLATLVGVHQAPLHDARYAYDKFMWIVKFMELQLEHELPDSPAAIRQLIELGEHTSPPRVLGDEFMIYAIAIGAVPRASDGNVSTATSFVDIFFGGCKSYNRDRSQDPMLL